jgi:hypothetical protein
MQKPYNLYHNLGYWFLLLIALVVAGFYVSYFSVLLQPRPSIIHIHFTLMALWIVMLIIQPFFIKYRKLYWHRFTGRVSYVLVPLLLLSAFLMIRYSYYHFIDDLQQQGKKGLNQFSGLEIAQKAASYEAIAFFYLIWFAIFYLLAIVNRRKSLIHSRYMLATGLTMLGPTVDRIFFINFHIEKLFGVIPVESVSFLIADVLLAFLFMKDYRKKKPVRTLGICLAIYLAGQVLFFTAPGNEWWTSFVSFAMKPFP